MNDIKRLKLDGPDAIKIALRDALRRDDFEKIHILSGLLVGPGDLSLLRDEQLFLLNLIPEGHDYGGDLDIFQYIWENGLDQDMEISLPKNLTIDGELDVSELNLAELPEGLRCEYNVRAKMSGLKRVHSGVYIRGFCSLEESKVTKIADGFHVEEGLYLQDTPLTRLPDDMYVGGDLDISGSQITTFPQRMYVGGAMFVCDRFEFNGIPDDCYIAGPIRRDGKIIDGEEIEPLI